MSAFGVGKIEINIFTLPLSHLSPLNYITMRSRPALRLLRARLFSTARVTFETSSCTEKKCEIFDFFLKVDLSCDKVNKYLLIMQ